MKPQIGAAAIGLFAFACACFAESPLDAPGEKKVTIATEISRGSRQVVEQASEHGSFNLEILDEEMAKVISRNNAANTDSEGFLFGARFQQWFILHTFLHHKNAAANNYLGEMKPAEAHARRYFTDMRRLQRSLNIDDDTLFSALGISGAAAPDLKSLMADYDAGPRATPTAQPLPEYGPPPPATPPEFIKLTKPFALVDPKGREVRTLPSGKRLRVISRGANEVVVDSFGESYSIPADITEPPK